MKNGGLIKNKKQRHANLQYAKLGFSRLFNGYGSNQVQCSLIGNRSVIPSFAYSHRFQI